MAQIHRGCGGKIKIDSSRGYHFDEPEDVEAFGPFVPMIICLECDEEIVGDAMIEYTGEDAWIEEQYQASRRPIMSRKTSLRSISDYDLVNWYIDHWRSLSTIRSELQARGFAVSPTGNLNVEAPGPEKRRLYERVRPAED